jgi:hypothetical protein
MAVSFRAATDLLTVKVARNTECRANSGGKVATTGGTHEVGDLAPGCSWGIVHPLTMVIHSGSEPATFAVEACDVR